MGGVPRGDQLSRQWRLLQLIDRATGVSIDDAARELECTRRTIFRDLNVLEKVFPIYRDGSAESPRTVLRLQEDFRRRLPLKLTLSELVALLMSRDLLAPLGATVLGQSIDSAYDKIRSILSRDAVLLIERMRDVVGVRAFGAKLQEASAEHLPRIQTALSERRALHVRYHSFKRDVETERRIDPYHLTWFDGGLYLIGHCHIRREVRIFAVERMREVRPLAARFEVPADFDPAAYLRDALGIIRGTQVTVRVRFEEPVARYIRERLWHPSQQVQELPGGRLEMRLRVADTLEVRRWILGYGPMAEVVEPAAMREALRAEAEALARLLAPQRPGLAVAARGGGAPADGQVTRDGATPGSRAPASRRPAGRARAR